MAQLAENEVRQEFIAFIQAMKDRDTKALRSLTREDFTLTHITGYAQPRIEWLAEIEQGKFVYHSIKALDIHVAGTEGGARVVARTLTDARVYGGRNTWKLRLAVFYVSRDDRWLADNLIASLWT
jgi:ketosteroid isomerase-like protein